MDVINIEDKENWMSCRLQQSILTQTELYTVIIISCVIMQASQMEISMVLLQFCN